MNRSPQDLVRNVKAIASLPAVFERINVVANKPNSSLGEVAAVISKDVGLTARLLKLVNSAYFGFPSKIADITQACVVAGTRNIRQLALATSVAEVFKSIPPGILNMPSFWRHSVACAMASRSIAVHAGLLDPDRYFVSGMLHDVGRLAMIQSIPEEFAAILSSAHSERRLAHHVEQETLGFSHAQVGEALLAAWGLPQALADLVAAHHRPASARSGLREAAVVHFGDVFAHALGLGESGNPFVSPLDPRAWDALSLPIDSLLQIASELDHQLEDMTEILCGDSHG
jgi:putative nucleotidyltransferase with HDIG domain